MNRLLEQILDEVQSAWRYRWWALLVAMLVAACGWTIIFSLRDMYEADTRVFVDTRTALKPVLQGLTVEQDVNAQLNYVRQSLLAAPQLRTIAKEAGVLPERELDAPTTARILQAMTERVTLTVRSANDRENDRDTAGSVYGISYVDGDRERALRVVNILKNTLVDQTLGNKRAGSETAQKFLETQIREYERRLRAAEDRLAEFKKQNIGLMPTEQGGYFAQLQADIDAGRRAETQLTIAESKRAELLRQLHGESVITAAGSAPAAGGGAVSTDTVSRIKEAQARLDDLLLRFTEKHPDVIAARQTLAELTQRRKDEIESLRRGDANTVASSGVGASPVFQSIQLALNQADVEIASLRGELEQTRAKAAELRQRLDTAPKVEAEFAQLNRDYDVNKQQYTALLANYEKAKLGEQADNAGSIRFQVVQPPFASFRPVSPRRTELLAAVLVFALVCGAGLAYLLHALKPVVGSAANLSDLTGLPVLGVVGSAFPKRQKAVARRQILTYGLAASCLIAAFICVLALNSMGVRLVLHSS